MTSRKRSLRGYIKSALNQLSEVEHHERSRLIHQKLFQHPWWQNASMIGLTLSYQYEVDTIPMIEQAWHEGKGVAVPLCDPETKAMHFRRIQSFEAVAPGYSGIREPIIDKSTYVEKDDLDLLIVPGLAFDERGFRLGYGGGFYDRYLSTFAYHTLGLCFHMQLVSDLPTDSYDIPVHGIITERDVRIV